MNDQIQTHTAYFDTDGCDVADLRDIIHQTQDRDAVPYASDVQKNVPLYDMAKLRPLLDVSDTRRAIMGEWGRVLLSGAGIIVLKQAYADTAVLDEATAIFENIIVAEKSNAVQGADHFAAAGANDRIWNSLQKLCEHDADVFLRYFANTSTAAASEAWLGPNYQMTAQVNLVYPGGAAQQTHRDYHLGFQTEEEVVKYPAHAHDLSPLLTLQGAIAHCDMPVESGPTKLLPFSQCYRPGYAAWRRADFRVLSEDHCIQLPQAKGDTLFFNPAVFHAAGANISTGIQRMANLMQIGSAIGRVLEAVDRKAMCKRIYPHALRAHQTNSIALPELTAAIGATAEGYPFPTSLDRDPPIGDLAPASLHATRA
jgi:ectoine hydroxylase-related dioxygenase (phytanoyl-CoA dioxygenase family)